jgi:1-acyl-sn-glycerol-3-phosphate acyltransferase
MTHVLYRPLNSVVRLVTGILCRIYDEQLVKVPPRGPLILVANHVSFIEVPILISHLQPRPITGFAKSENWDNPVTRFLFHVWGGIPLRRGTPDTVAFRQALKALDEGYIMAVAPEGTRSGDGVLQRGIPGVVLLALRTGVPLLPMAYYGGEQFRHRLPRLRRTDFHIAIGRSFYLRAGNGRVTPEVRQQMVDEIMYQIAALLPPSYRGYYADLSAATEEYLEFPLGSGSNLAA